MKSKINNPEVITQSLLDVLKESGELSLLPEIADELEEELGKKKNPKEVVVIGAIEIKGDQKKELEHVLSRFLTHPVPFTYQHDASLLGGFTVQIGDWFLDASIRHELNELKTALES
ncbi:hypothetical protein A3D77_08035 [Candidatus Gottesmanbacteria bacterium RIFCSPHIGHO2_02_FULL_39_11]|uniref:Uncharacterized protein n=1 Tax=Candidatus Gottesmanbacteria bacterium RIFCSPHIGHO2_02_FULL_39_11 TaxID=1798382 RepID=A0A1F5ZX52_9BACT|nr:MAG: hypothetical protein A3D77_08035 [Candidatus Gottesmanbacteria bacterium RIFCSPHIGHO2_02_FULL_39_11]